MIRINDVIDKIVENNPDAGTDLVVRAYIYSAKVHEGQVRLSGEPYLTHPLEVASILADMNLDVVSVAAGLLHDVLEDTPTTEEDLREMFGDDVRHIVSGVSKISVLKFDSYQRRQAESIRKMLLAMADDIRVILIKLADRLHNMKTLRFHKEHKRKAIAQETADIYAPIASRLGIYWIKKELEDLAFMYLFPAEHDRIKHWVSKDKAEREEYVDTVVQLIGERMEQEKIPCEVFGRYKHFFSIHQKMKSQGLSFNDVYDVIAFRIIVDTKSQCYEALGVLHDMWKPIDIKFKDYIGRPKPNMYQSLHTTVIGPFGERMEIQIRTWDMDRVAKSGIAAHWSYKEGRHVDENLSQKFAWIQELIENQESVVDPDEFMENVKIDLFPDEVYVFTPTGEIKTLAKGSTPVDFAYLIHTEVGNQCSGAKVNGRMVPLRYELKTGDVVEVITAKGHHPSKDWLNFVKTVKARSRIRQWIKSQEKERSITLGREMCEKEFQKYRLNYNNLVKSDEMGKAVEAFGFKTLDDLIAAVGYGKITPLQIVRKLTPKEVQEADNEAALNKLINKTEKKRSADGVMVKGMDDILVRFGKCCQPVPGDPITGYITRGYGVTVHKASCVNALKMNPERQIDVKWNSDGAGAYPVKIRIISHDRVGLLADMASTISKTGANITNASSEVREDGVVDSYFTLFVKDTDHLNQVLSAIQRLKLILEVKRLDH